MLLVLTVMIPKKFIDPLGSRLPALERTILKLRAMEMVLVMFYAEELKRGVLDKIQATDDLMAKLNDDEALLERVPKGTKNPVDKALNALVADKAISAKDKDEIVKLIDYRNAIGHQLHNLLLDLSTERVAREILVYGPDHLPKYDYDAVQRLRHFLKLLDGLYRTHHYVTTMNYNGMVFRSAEKALLSEIKRLRRRIDKLATIRHAQIKRVNSELSLEGTGLQGELDPRHPLNKYDDGRLTKRGEEICYRLFDLERSPMAVAHLTGLSLVAVKKRHRMWIALGGAQRSKIDMATLPHRRFYARYDD